MRHSAKAEMFGKQALYWFRPLKPSSGVPADVFAAEPAPEAVAGAKGGVGRGRHLGVVGRRRANVISC